MFLTGLLILLWNTLRFLDIYLFLMEVRLGFNLLSDIYCLLLYSPMFGLFVIRDGGLFASTDKSYWVFAELLLGVLALFSF